MHIFIIRTALRPHITEITLRPYADAPSRYDVTTPIKPND